MKRQFGLRVHFAVLFYQFKYIEADLHHTSLIEFFCDPKYFGWIQFILGGIQMKTDLLIRLAKYFARKGTVWMEPLDRNHVKRTTLLVTMLLATSANAQTVRCEHSDNGSVTTCRQDNFGGGTHIDPFVLERATRRGEQLNREAERAAREEADWRRQRERDDYEFQRRQHLDREAELLRRREAERSRSAVQAQSSFGVGRQVSPEKCVYYPEGGDHFVIDGRAYRTIGVPGNCVKRIMVLPNGNMQAVN